MENKAHVAPLIHSQQNTIDKNMAHYMLLVCSCKILYKHIHVSLFILEICIHSVSLTLVHSVDVVWYVRVDICFVRLSLLSLS